MRRDGGPRRGAPRPERGDPREEPRDEGLDEEKVAHLEEQERKFVDRRRAAEAEQREAELRRLSADLEKTRAQARETLAAARTDARNVFERSEANVRRLESQIRVLEAALSTAAAEKDESQAAHARDVAKLEMTENKVEEFALLFEESQDTARELRADRDRLEAELARVVAEAANRAEPVAPRETQPSSPTTTTTTTNSALHAALAAEKLESQRLDAENVELAALADFLRQQVLQLHNEAEVATSKERTIATERERTLQKRLDESEARAKALEDNVARLETSLNDERELIALAASEDGLSETVRRNKKLKAIIRRRDQELDELRAASQALRTRRDNPEHALDDQKRLFSYTDASHVEEQVDRTDLESDRNRKGNGKRGGFTPSKKDNKMPIRAGETMMTTVDAVEARRVDTSHEAARKNAAAHIVRQQEPMSHRDEHKSVDDVNSPMSSPISTRVQGQIELRARDDAAPRELESVIPNYDMSPHDDIESVNATNMAPRDNTRVSSPHQPPVCAARPRTQDLGANMAAELPSRVLQDMQDQLGAALAERLDGTLRELAAAQAGPFHVIAKQKEEPPQVVTQAGPAEVFASIPLSTNPSSAVQRAWLARCCIEASSDEMTEVYRALARALEALDVSERERVIQDQALAITSGKLALVRHQLAVSYDRYAHTLAKHEKIVASLRAELNATAEAKHALELGEDLPTNPFEANELVLRRRYLAVKAELDTEVACRRSVESAGHENEAALVARVLYLELWKKAATLRLARVEAHLDAPLNDDASCNDASESAHSLEIRRAQSMAEAAMSQAADLARLRDAALAERDAYAERALEREAYSDDRNQYLERELVVVRTAHRSLLQRHEALRRHLLERTKAARAVERELVSVAAAAAKSRDEQRARVAALRAAAAAAHNAKANNHVKSERESPESACSTCSATQVALEASRVECDNLRLMLGGGENIIENRLLSLGNELKDLKIELTRVRADASRHAAAFRGERRARLDADRARIEVESRALMKVVDAPRWDDFVQENSSLECLFLESIGNRRVDVSTSISPREGGEIDAATAPPSSKPPQPTTERRPTDASTSPVNMHETPLVMSLAAAPPERVRLAQAACQTIGSLRTLVAEKNKRITALEAKLESTTAMMRADRHSDWRHREKVSQCLYNEHDASIAALKGAAKTLEGKICDEQLGIADEYND